MNLQSRPYAIGLLIIVMLVGVLLIRYEEMIQYSIDGDPEQIKQSLKTQSPQTAVDEPQRPAPNSNVLTIREPPNSKINRLVLSTPLNQLTKGDKIQLGLDGYETQLTISEVSQVGQISSLKASRGGERIRLTFGMETVIGTASLNSGVYELRGNPLELSYQSAGELMQSKSAKDYRTAPDATGRQPPPNALLLEEQ